MDKENQRVTISKRMMKEGLLRCLKYTEIDKISISDLCRESGINRATFYHHYQLPKDVLLDIGWEHTMEIKRIFESDQRLPLEKRMTDCFNYIYDNRETLKILFSSNADTRFAGEVTKIFPWAWTNIIDLKKKYSLDEDEYRLFAASYSWSAYHIVREWVIKDINKTPEEITKLFIKIHGRDFYEN